MSLVPFKVYDNASVPQTLSAANVLVSSSVGATAGNSLNLDTNGTTKMVILTSGRVGIGTFTPSSMLYVSGNGGAEVAVFESTTVGAAKIRIQGTDRSGTLAAEVMQVPGSYQSGLISLGSLGMQGNLAGIAFNNGNATYQYGAIGPDVYNGFKYMLGNPGILSGAGAGVTLMYFSSAENVGINTTTPNAKFSVNGAMSGNSIIYSGNSNSTLWGSSYTTVNANSARWSSAYTTINAQSANNASVYSTVNANSATWGTGTSSGGGLTIFKEVSSTASPNNVTTVHALTVVSAVANVDVALVAKGTGATLAQIPDNTSANGDKRGQYATDWQKTRALTSQVASGNYSVIGGGLSNTASAVQAVVGGGNENNAAGQASTIAGGQSNDTSAFWATIGGGLDNTAGGQTSTIAGGQSNNAFSSYATVGGGINNSANSAYSTIAGGAGNFANGTYSTVAGGSTNNAVGSYSTIPGGYGAVAPTHGQYAYASSYFGSAGDAQHVQYVLYGTVINGGTVVLSVDNANNPPGNSNITSLLVPNQAMMAMFTIQVLGFDDSQNFSQAMRKVVIRKVASNSYNEELLHIESIGTDVTTAGAIGFGIETSAVPEQVFTVTGASNAAERVRWIAHVSGIWVFEPPAYP
jgi:hypothetical protein